MIRASVVFFLALCTACGGKQPGPAAPATAKADSSQHSEPYFPVGDFLASEIAAVDSLPVAVMKYTTVANRTDSGYIDRKEFHRLAGEFSSASLGGQNFQQLFSESSFIDRASGNATFFYAARSDTSAIRRVDVIAEKTDTYDRVRSIYIEKTDTSGGQETIKRLFWKAARNFQIITQHAGASGTPKTEVVKVVWDNRE